MIDEFLDNIVNRIGGYVSGWSDYMFLAEWYVLGVVLLIGSLAVSWFFGALPVIGKWIRGLGGVAVLGYAAFLAGLQVMYNHRHKR